MGDPPNITGLNANRAGVHPSPLRYLIVGAPGGGKSTLARRLSARLGAPYYELDAVIYDGGAGAKRPCPDRVVLLREILSRPAWVAEGNYLWWAESLYVAADSIVWIDLPWYVATARVIRRHVRESLKGANRHRGLLKLARFVWRYRSYYRDKVPDAPAGPDDDKAGNRAATAMFLAKYSHKLVHCRSQRQVEEFLSRTLAQAGR